MKRSTGGRLAAALSILAITACGPSVKSNGRYPDTNKATPLAADAVGSTNAAATSTATSIVTGSGVGTTAAGAGPAAAPGPGSCPVPTSGSGTTGASPNAAPVTPAAAAPASYAATAEPVINRACLSCHATQLPTLGNAAAAAAVGPAILADVTTGRMPPGGGLSAADIAAIQSWANGGYLSLALNLATPTPPGYLDTVAPLLNAKCTWCHSPTAAANVRTTPDLSTYDAAKLRASNIYEQMTQGTMPPAGAQPTLATGDAAIISAWRTAGYPMGTAPTVPAAGQPVYYLGGIDAILTANCTGCHTTGLQAPDLSNYAGAQAAGPLALAAVQKGTMPPSGALSAAYQAAFQSWADGGYLYDGNGTPPPPAPVSTPPTATSTSTDTSTGTNTSTSSAASQTTPNTCP